MSFRGGENLGWKAGAPLGTLDDWNGVWTGGGPGRLLLRPKLGGFYVEMRLLCEIPRTSPVGNSLDDVRNGENESPADIPGTMDVESKCVWDDSLGDE